MILAQACMAHRLLAMASPRSSLPACFTLHTSPLLSLPHPLVTPIAVQATSVLRLLHEFYTDARKHAFVHAFNHNQSEFDFKRMLDSMGHDTSEIPR